MQEFVNSCVRPPTAEGFIDKAGKFHCCYAKRPKVRERDGGEWHRCFIEECEQDHSSGDARGEKPFKVWELPVEGCEYAVGADVAEGLGADADYSVGVVIKVSRSGGQDEVVAVFRSNTTDPIEFAYQLNWIGRWYNEAMLAVELNKYDTTATWVRMQLSYPNLYRWKNMDSLNIMSSKLGWVTQANSKPRLWQTMNKYLRDRLLINPSRNFAEEIKTFKKEDAEDRSGGAGEGFWDDEAMACMIALYTAHEADWDDQTGQILTRQLLSMENAPWKMKCAGCGLQWPAKSPEEWPVSSPTMKGRCPGCGSRMVGGSRNMDAPGAPQPPDFLTQAMNDDFYRDQYDRMMDKWGISKEGEDPPEYELL